MKKFYYTAVNTKGVEWSGMTEAESREEAIELLKKRDLFPTYVNGLDDGPMRPIPPPPRVMIEGGPGGDKFLGYVLLALAIIFIFSMVAVAGSALQDWKIKKMVKQMVQNECLVDQYRRESK